jgi:hypothetical protein
MNLPATTVSTEPGTPTSCICDTTPVLPEGQAHIDCTEHGFDLNTVEGIAKMLRYAGVEIGYVGGEAIREHYATRLLPVLRQQYAAVHEDAYRSGINDEATSQDWTDGAASPNRANPYKATI